MCRTFYARLNITTYQTNGLYLSDFTFSVNNKWVFTVNLVPQIAQIFFLVVSLPTQYVLIFSDCVPLFTPALFLDVVRFSDVFLIHAYMACRVHLLRSCFALHWRPFSKISFYKNSRDLILKKITFFCSCTKAAQHNYSQSSYGAEETTAEALCI